MGKAGTSAFSFGLTDCYFTSVQKPLSKTERSVKLNFTATKNGAAIIAAATDTIVSGDAPCGVTLHKNGNLVFSTVGAGARPGSSATIPIEIRAGDTLMIASYVGYPERLTSGNLQVLACGTAEPINFV